MSPLVPANSMRGASFKLSPSLHSDTLNPVRTISSARMPLRWLLYRDTIHCRPTIWYSRSAAPGGGCSVRGASWMDSPTLCASLQHDSGWVQHYCLRVMKRLAGMSACDALHVMTEATHTGVQCSNHKQLMNSVVLTSLRGDRPHFWLTGIAESSSRVVAALGVPDVVPRPRHELRLGGSLRSCGRRGSLNTAHAEDMTTNSALQSGQLSSRAHVHATREMPILLHLAKEAFV
jgi:hypothetical protein